MPPTIRCLSRKTRWFRPALELLERRLPPGDTILGLLLSGGLLDAPISDSCFANESVIDTVVTWSRTRNDISLGSHPNSNATCESVVTWSEDHMVAPGRATQRSSVPLSADVAQARANPRRSVPPLLATSALGSMASATPLTSFPNSGSGTPVREIPFRNASSDETELLGNAFPNGSSGTSVSGAAARNYGSTPFYFEQNVGQADPSFDFVARGAGYTLGLTATEAVMAMPAENSEFRIQNSQLNVEGREKADLLPNGQRIGEAVSEPVDAPMLRMQIVGANAAAPVAGVDQLVTKINYLIGSDPNQWHPNVPTFAKVQYDDVYPGIDLAYYGQGRDLEYDFIVAPGADPDQIRLNFTGADAVDIDAVGNLVLQTGEAQIRQHAPYIYQEVNGARQQITGSFVLNVTDSDYRVSFELGKYDAARPLVIDPMVVSYSTYFGGPSSEYNPRIAVDSSGSAYLSGQAYSGFPTLNGAQPYGGGGDAYVAKFSPDGQTLIYSTYVGGQHEESAFGVAVDFKGAAYITGFTESGNFPTTAGVFQPIISGGSCNGNSSCADAFVVKLNPSGSAMVYSTFLGALGGDSADGITVDSAGNAYIKGQTQSAQFPVLNAVQPTYGGGGCTQGAFSYPCNDAFVTKLNSSGSGLVYSTYLGGNRDEAFFFSTGGAIAVDTTGHAYVTGYTESGNFPTYNPFQATRIGGVDAYVTKLSPDGGSFIYSTYLGGSPGENGYGIAADAVGHAYVTGITYADDFPTTPDAFQPTKTGGGSNADAFVSKFTPDGSGLVYSTFLGADEHEAAGSIVVDLAGHAYVGGSTYSSNFPTVNAFQPDFAGGPNDGFITKLAPNGSALVYSSFLGGSDTEGGPRVALDTFANVYLGGATRSTDFPMVKPLQAQNAGGLDAYVTKISRFAREAVQSEPLP